MARVRFISSAVCAVLALPCLASPANGAAVDFVQPSQRSFQEYLDLLSIPNIAVEPRDMQRNAEFLEQSFRKRGFDTQRLENSAGTPLVFAQLAKSRRGAPTVMFYIHFDGQPVIPEEWAQENPFTPVVKERTGSGQWKAAGHSRH